MNDRGNDIALREYIETRLDAMAREFKAAVEAGDRATMAKFEASEKAIVKAEEAQKAYNASHNDLSRKMDAQYQAMMPRSESLAMHENTREKIEGLRKEYDAKLESQLKLSDSRHGTITSELAVLRGKSAGIQSSWAFLVAAVVLIATVIGIFVSLKR